MLPVAFFVPVGEYVACRMGVADRPTPNHDLLRRQSPVTSLISLPRLVIMDK